MKSTVQIKNVIGFLAIISLGIACQNSPTASTDSQETTATAPESQEKEVSYSEEELTKLGMDVSSTLPQGLEMGVQAPDFQGIDQNGNSVSLQEKLADGPVVLVFYRGYWCGKCKKFLGEFADSLSMVQEKGATVLAVAPEVAENAQKMVEKTGFDVPVISDSDLSIMEAYGVNFHVTQAYQDKILNYAGSSIPEINGMEDAYLPVPATYIINQEGMIAFAHFDQNYRSRASVQDILAAL